jgi:hypothetical protein
MREMARVCCGSHQALTKNYFRGKIAPSKVSTVSAVVPSRRFVTSARSKLNAFTSAVLFFINASTKL